MVLKKGHTNVCAESLGFSGPRVTPFLSFQKQKIVFAAARFFYYANTIFYRHHDADWQ